MLVIHGVPVSVHARKVIVAAELKGLDYRVEPVIPLSPPEGWGDLSPAGQIPAIEDEGLRLADSTAICAYLDRKHPETTVFPREGAEALGRAVWFDAYAGGILFRTLVQGLLAQKVIRPNFRGEACDEAEVARMRTEVEPKVFGYLETQAGGGYLVGEGLTIADLAITSNLINFRYLGFEIDAGRYPRLAAYVARMLDEPVFRKALAAEQPFAERLGLDRSFIGAALEAA